MVSIDDKGNITVYSGDDDTITLQYSPAREISSYSLRFTVKPYDSTTTDDSDALLETDPSDVVFTDDGTIAVIPINVSSNRITAGTYKFDIQNITANDAVHTYHSGKFIVTNDVTKRTS